MKIKICGIKDENEIKIVNETMPDFIGFVFAKSKRKIDLETAFILKSKLNPKIKTAGVFVDTSVQDIIKYKEIVDFAQLHSGRYTEKDIILLKEAGLGVIKVIRVQKDEYTVKTAADFVLFDTFLPAIAGGGNKTFNWNIKISSNVPYFVAGGLNDRNIREMAEKLKPYGADISSGAEENGHKTKEKVSGIIKAVRGINL